jgi:hypothetical protein
MEESYIVGTFSVELIGEETLTSLQILRFVIFFVCSTFTFSLRWLAAPIYYCIIKKNKKCQQGKGNAYFPRWRPN